MGREFFESVTELCEATRSEKLGHVKFRGMRVAGDRLLETPPFRREPHDARAPVDGIRPAGDVTALFEVSQQIVDRLSRDLELPGEIGRALTVEPGIAEHCDVRGVQVAVPVADDAGEDLVANPLPTWP